MTDIGLARLLQLCSPALPVGAYAYSTGQESAVEHGLLTDVASTRQWITGTYTQGLGKLDLPALFMACEAMMSENGQRLLDLDAYLRASRETSELRLEDLQMGQSLTRLCPALDIELIARPEPTFVTTFAEVGTRWQISAAALGWGFSYAWLENQIGVATKSVPLGQSQAQALLAQLCELIEPATTAAADVAAAQPDNPDEWDFGQSLPGLAILSSRHEQQTSRLYRS
jgi:urease accessory protein